MSGFVSEELDQICNKCGLSKSIDLFPFRDKQNEVIGKICKECKNKTVREWRKNNPEKEAASQKDYYERNKEYIGNLRKEHYYNYREEHLEQKKIYYQENRESILEYKRTYHEENKDHILERNKQWQKNNRQRINKRRRERYKEDENYKLRCSMKEMVKRVLKETEKHAGTQYLLGYSSDDFRKRLEYQFQPGMNWDNYGVVWNIDHKIPVNHFFKKGETRPHIINALSNLQPMWANENFRKQDNINYG